MGTRSLYLAGDVFSQRGRLVSALVLFASVGLAASRIARSARNRNGLGALRAVPSGFYALDMQRSYERALDKALKDKRWEDAVILSIH